MSSQCLGGALERAEPDSEHHCSPVLRSDVVPTGDAEGPGAERRAAPPAPALPCHNSNSCIEKEKKKTEPLSPYRKKSRHRLITAVEGVVKKHGINRVGLLTLSFGVPGSGRGSEATRELREQAKDLDFVQARWHSFSSNVVTKRYEDWICVLEPHRDGVWHLHVVVLSKQTFGPALTLKRSPTTSCLTGCGAGSICAMRRWRRNGRCCGKPAASIVAGGRNEMTEKSRRDLCPQITGQMYADGKGRTLILFLSA